MPIFIISLFVQVALVVHIVKTGRSTTWIWIVVMLPMAGSIAYFILEILPELSQSSAGRKTKKNVGKLINPDKELKAALHNYSITETVENSNRLAEAYTAKGMFEEARQLYEKSLKGIYSTDPDIMHRLASANFELKDFKQAKQLLDDLIVKNPDFKNADAHLLYAKVLEQLGETESALKEYQVLDGYYKGLEATYRYSMLLKKTGDNKKATELFEKILHKSKISSKHYNSLQKEWINKTKNEVTR